MPHLPPWPLRKRVQKVEPRPPVDPRLGRPKRKLPSPAQGCEVRIVREETVPRRKGKPTKMKTKERTAATPSGKQPRPRLGLHTSRWTSVGSLRSYSNTQLPDRWSR